MGDSTIQASDELKDALHELKERGDSYEDVVWRLLSEDRSQSDGDAK